MWRAKFALSSNSTQKKYSLSPIRKESLQNQNKDSLATTKRNKEDLVNDLK